MRNSVPSTRRNRVVVVCAVVALLATACDPGWVNPVAGTGDGSGAPGVAAPVDDASFDTPGAVAVSPVDGSLYVADIGACTISHITGGQVTPVAGVPGSCGDTGDGGPATDAEIQPGRVQVAPDGTVYFLQAGTAIRRITPDGVIDAVPYTPPAPQLGAIAGYSVDDAGAVTVLQATYLASSGILYVSRVAEDGTQDLVTTKSLSGIAAVFSAVPIDDHTFGIVSGGLAPALSSVWRYDVNNGDEDHVLTAGGPVPQLLAADRDGTLYLGSSNFIIRFDPPGASWGVTIAGTGSADPGTARYQGLASDQPVSPRGAAVTRNGGLVFTSGHVVYRMEAPKHVTTTTVAAT